MEYTLALIKPDAVEVGLSGQIIELIEQNGFEVAEIKKGQLSEDDAKSFYAAHSEKPFFGELVEYVTSGPIIALKLAGENAVSDWRELMGETDPEKARIGTIRCMFGVDIGTNAVHGSDSAETAKSELEFFFPEA
jgi:nucleoside-diphosphate kinase